MWPRACVRVPAPLVVLVRPVQTTATATIDVQYVLLCYVPALLASFFFSLAFICSMCVFEI